MNKTEILADGRINRVSQVYEVKRYTVNGGAENGLRVIECVNGKLRFLLNESKALDIMQIFYEGINTSFVSKNGFSARELPFISRFEGGALYTCGLDAVGEVQGKEMHGSLHNIPAALSRAECAEDGLIVEAEMRYSALFGQNLLLRRKIFSPYGSGRIEVSDTLINEGKKPQDYCLLYHVNLGYPLLDEGGKILVETKKVTPRTPYAEQKVSVWNVAEKPVDNQEETCYYLSPVDNIAAYFNPKLNRKFTLKFCDGLDKFILWKSMASGDYALGLEPSTTELDANFAYKRIAAGESKSFSLTFTVE